MESNLRFIDNEEKNNNNSNDIRKDVEDDEYITSLPNWSIEPEFEL